MSRTNTFLLQLFFILQVGLLCGLFVIRFYPKEIASATETMSQIISPITEVIERSETKVVFYPPEKIKLPSLGLDLSVKEGAIVAGEWTLFDDSVSWLATSARVNEGNMILYAHNRKHLFGRLTELKVGDTIEIEAGGKTTFYQVNMTRKVLPTDVDSVISDKNQLTLYTCNGRFDERRLIVIAEPV